MLSFCYFSYFYLAEPQPVPNTIQLIWTNEYKINGQKLRGFTETVDGDKLYTVYTFQTEDEKQLYESTSLTGYTFLAKGELVEPNPPAHNYAFSMENYLQSKGARGTFEVSNWQFIEVKKSIPTMLAEQRFKLKQHIEEIFPDSLVAEAQALLIGLQDNVDEDLQRAYQKLGITHLFAISGLHIALVAWIFYEGLLRLRVRKEIAMIVLLVVLPIYGVIAGGAPSVWRSVSVVEFVMLARYFKWRVSMDDALAISFIGFVLLEPSVIYQVGFQLSYLATISIIYSSKILTHWSNWWMKSFFLTFVCQLLVYPLLLVHFYEISISSLLVNIVFVPLFSFVILPINIVLLLLSFISETVVGWLFIIYEPLRTWLTEWILYMQSIPYQMWSPGKPSGWLITFAFLSIFVVFYLLEQRGRLWQVLVVLFVPIICIHWAPALDGDLRVTFINVGQGDCVVIELPYRRGVYMVDSGGLLRFGQESWKESNRPYEVGRQVVVPFLKGRGIRIIDIFTMSHADADHVEGAEEVLSEVAMKEVHVTPGSLEESVLNDFIALAREKKVLIKEQMAGHGWQENGVIFSYLWPKELEYEGNNDSLVLFVQKDAFRMLLTGDLEELGERALVRDYEELLQDITVLKAGHHGSKTSSSEPFVSLMNPKLTIFSAGLNNRYGHPHPIVIERFMSRELPYFTTAIDGTIMIRVREDAIEVEGFQ